LTIAHRLDSFAITETDAEGRVVERSPWMSAPMCQQRLVSYVDEDAALLLMHTAIEERTFELRGREAPELGFRAARAAANPPGTFARSSVETVVRGLLIAGGLLAVSGAVRLLVAIFG